MTKKVKAGVVGWPISHSLSPRLHGFWLDRHALNGEYLAYAVKPEDLGNFLKKMPEKNITGLNLTVPHKEIAFPYLDEIDETAEKIGAVNMVTQRNGRLLGSNSDGYGFLTNLKQCADNWFAEQGPVGIFGAGGAARAAIVSLLDDGVPELTIFNRTRERAEELATLFQNPRIKVGDWEGRAQGLSEVSLLVNTTTLGMAGQSPLECDLSHLPQAATVYDIVYNPLETPLLKQARLRGNSCVDGLGMLFHQAVPAFKAWFAQSVEVDDILRKHMLEAL